MDNSRICNLGISLIKLNFYFFDRLEEKDNEISLLNKNLYDLTEKIEYNENKKDRELRKYEETERELGTIQEKIIYLEKLLTQKDSEIEQLKQIVEDSNQRVKRSTIPNEKPSILEKS
jgi:chromosome segregation ATPase